MEAFRAYSTLVKYAVSRKGDASFLGRFTLESLLNFEGMRRILTILARGYLPDIDRAGDVRCAWYSHSRWRERFGRLGGEIHHLPPELHAIFPELVDENGYGWCIRYIRVTAAFAK